MPVRPTSHKLRRSPGRGRAPEQRPRRSPTPLQLVFLLARRKLVSRRRRFSSWLSTAVVRHHLHMAEGRRNPRRATEVRGMPTSSRSIDSKSPILVGRASSMVSSTSTARRIGFNALRLCCLCLGAWLTAVLPVAIWAELRRTANAEAGLLPNMEPGVAVALVAIMALAPVVTALVIEVVRTWAMGFKPLALPSYVALGALASWPLGWALAGRAPRSVADILTGSAMGLLAFYFVRMAWIFSRKRHRSTPPSGTPESGR